MSDFTLVESIGKTGSIGDWKLIRIFGPTFDVRDILKAAGAKWNGEKKCWEIPYKQSPARCLIQSLKEAMHDVNVTPPVELLLNQKFCQDSANEK